MSRDVAQALKEIGTRSQDGYNRPGVWVGRVEDIDDPQRLNRVRVRVFAIHGDKRSTPTTALPWCEVSDFGGGGFDYGSGGSLYPVGSTVWVSFEMGDDRRPVVLGGRRGAAVRDDKNPVEFLTVDGRSYNQVEQTWLPEEGNEIPKDVFDDSSNDDTHPTRCVWKKSYKGHTIMCEDRDGFEFLKIIDRAGQVIEMNCPVTVEDNANNAQQRGNRNASNDTQLPQSVLVNQKAFIRIKDAGGQEILLEGSGGNEKIAIRSRNRQGSSRQTILLDSSKGREKIVIVDKQNNQISIDPNQADQSIVMQDYSGNKVTFDAENGRLLIESKSTEEHQGSAYSYNFGADSTGIIGGNDDKKILGNKFLDVLNDFTTAVSGAASSIYSGTVQWQVVNSPASGAPAGTPLSFEIALGGFNVNSQLATDPMSITALAGDIELETLAGNISASTLTGNVNMTTLSGQGEFGTEAGSTTIKGPLGINLGFPAAFSVTFGETVAQAFTAIGASAAGDVRLLFGAIPIPPTTLLALPGILAPLSAPGVLFSLLNKSQ